jgi:hypothetical protein
MSYHTFQQYIFDTDLSSEPSINFQNNSEAMLMHLQSQLQLRQLATSIPDPSTHIYITSNILSPYSYTPSIKFLKLLDNFDSTILNQFICAACVYCGRLMYPEKCKWTHYNENLLYPLLQAYPEKDPLSLLTFHVNLSKHIAICPTCQKSTSRYSFPFFHPIPNEILNVLLGN